MWRWMRDRLEGVTDGDDDAYVDARGGPPPRRPGESDADRLVRLAREHLPPDVAETWLGLLRPAVRLAPAGPEEPVVARLGGSPRLPADTEWPEWPGHGPLSFIAEVDLTALADLGLDAGIPLPGTGRLAAFYFDGSYDGFAGVVGPWDSETQAGARLLHLPSGRDEDEHRPPPDGVPVFPERLLTARQVLTAPTWEHPVLRRAFGAPAKHERWMRHPVNAEAFMEAVWDEDELDPHHQIGGYADHVQGPVEAEIAQAVLDLGEDWSDPRAEAEAERWTLLLQIGSEDDAEPGDQHDEMMWGDMGRLYWLARHDDLERGDLGGTSFTWQCG